MYTYEVKFDCDQSATMVLRPVVVEIPRRSFDAAVRVASKKIHACFKCTPYTFSVVSVTFVC